MARIVIARSAGPGSVVSMKKCPMNAADMIRVEVVHIAESTTVRVPRGTKVGDIEDTLHHVLNIPKRSQVRMNGRLVRRRERLEEDGTLEFIACDRGHKGGDYYSEDRLLRLGLSRQWIDDFCATHLHPQEWTTGEGGRFLQGEAVIRASFVRSGQEPTLDAECQKALEHYGKTADLDKLSGPQKFSLVVAFWADTEGLTPARIRDKYRGVSSPAYPLPSSKKSARERVKTGIVRGRKLLAKLD